MHHYSSCGHLLTLAIIFMIVNKSYLADEDVVNQKVKVTVLHESLCPDSKNFWNYQLAPAYASLSSIMDVEPIAFGHASIKDDNTMKCQHGTQECIGNRIHACIIDMAQSQQQFVEAIDCIFKNYRKSGDWSNKAKECVEKKTKLSWSAVYDDCAMKQKGFDFMRKNANITGKIGYVPKIMLNGQYSDEIQNEAEYGLANYVCKIYKGVNRPKSCPQTI